MQGPYANAATSDKLVNGALMSVEKGQNEEFAGGEEGWATRSNLTFIFEKVALLGGRVKSKASLTGLGATATSHTILLWVCLAS